VARGFSGRMVRETGQTRKGTLGGLNRGGEEKNKETQGPKLTMGGQGAIGRMWCAELVGGDTFCLER
jgi:hypothetical protein